MALRDTPASIFRIVVVKGGVLSEYRRIQIRLCVFGLGQRAIRNENSRYPLFEHRSGIVPLLNPALVVRSLRKVAALLLPSPQHDKIVLSCRPRLVWISIDMILKLFPEARMPRKTPEGVPDASPRTITRSPATRTSLISHFTSGKASPRLLNPPINFARGMQTSLPPHVIQSDEVACSINLITSIPAGRFNAT